VDFLQITEYDMKQIGAFAMVFVIMALNCHGQSPKAHPVALKADLSGFLTNTLAVEGEMKLSRKFSVLAQAGVVRSGPYSRSLHGIGCVGRAGIKYYPLAKEKEGFGGFSIRAFGIVRPWSMVQWHRKLNSTCYGAFVEAGYAFRFHGVLLEPLMGFGRAIETYRYFRTSYGGWSPNPPWTMLSWSSRSTLDSHTRTGWCVSFGLMMGFRL
jgi:hypothetical protein